MKRITRIAEMHAWSEHMRREGKSIGFAPTMGALHEGHLSLVRAAMATCDRVVVSIFVNPTQFGPHEDYRRYPRDIPRDLKRLRKQGIDIAFTPTVREMYPEGFSTRVHTGLLANKLCGPFRPGHFDGVATVVLKLFEIVDPDIAFFGQKDYQQQLIIKQMVRDFNVRIKIVDLPTVREPDGLAMSSRNQYLTPGERVHAMWLYRSLLYARELMDQGGRSPGTIRQHIRKIIKKIPHSRIDYISICDPETLQEKARIEGKILIALAVWVGKTRLIDNMII